MKKIYYIFSLISLMFFSACENQDWSFPDYGKTTVYFSYQYPVRTIVLGNDETFDNTVDNQHKCIIKATEMWFLCLLIIIHYLLIRL